MSISDTYQPIRKHQTVYGSISGNYAFRGKKTIWYESTLERDYLKKLDFDQAVIDIVSQPVKIPYITSNGNQSTYTPDFLTQRLSPTGESQYILAEIKPSKKLRKEWHLFKPKFKAAIAFARSKGWVFHIYDETRIRDQQLSNIDYLKRFERSEFPRENSERIIETLQNTGSCSVDTLANLTNLPGQNPLMNISNIWHLIANREINCNIDNLLSNETIVWAKQSVVEKE